jgi:hypothetical protein
MRTGSEWADMKLGEGVRLLLGWRDSDTGGLDGLPVDLANDIADSLLAACRSTLALMKDRQRKPYSNLGNVDVDEFLALEIHEPPEDDGGTETVELEELLGAADIVELSKGAFAQEQFLSRADLDEGGWLFYAVVVEVEGADHPTAFIRQYNPQRGFGTGKLLSFYSDKLKKTIDPVFLFDLHFDLIVAADEVAVLSATAFQRVFADAGVVESEIPGHAQSLSSSLSVSLSAASTAALIVACTERNRLAARLRKLARAAHLDLVTEESLRAALDKHGLPSDRFGATAELEVTNLTDVRQLLDVLEKRYYEEDFTGYHMRADNASPLT